MTTYTMYDSVTPSDIPEGVLIAGGYVDGAYAWPADAWARFPLAIRFTIEPTNYSADFLDCEPGNPVDTPFGAAQYLVNASQAGNANPGIYVDRSMWENQGLKAICATLGFQHSVMVADWTGEEHTVDGADIVQFASPSVGSPGHFDISTIYSGPWLERAAAVQNAPSPDPTPDPTPEPPPQPTVEFRELQVVEPNMTGPDVLVCQYIVGASPDGIYGPETAAKVEAYQAANDLASDGIVGPQTWPVMLRFPGLATPGAYGQWVVIWQAVLNCLAHAGLVVDGADGPATTTAIKDVQQALGIAVDGMGGPQTWTALVVNA